MNNEEDFGKFDFLKLHFSKPDQRLTQQFNIFCSIDLFSVM